MKFQGFYSPRGPKVNTGFVIAVREGLKLHEDQKLIPVSEHTLFEPGLNPDKPIYAFKFLSGDVVCGNYLFVVNFIRVNYQDIIVDAPFVTMDVAIFIDDFAMYQRAMDAIRNMGLIRGMEQEEFKPFVEKI